MKAMEVLQQICRENNSPLPPGSLVVDSIDSQKHSILDMLVPAYRRTSLTLFVLMFGCVFCYYGKSTNLHSNVFGLLCALFFDSFFCANHIH